MLNRVLSDKTKLPAACVPASPSSLQSLSAKAKTSSEESGGLTNIARRLTGAAPGAFNIVSTSRSSKKGRWAFFPTFVTCMVNLALV